MSRSQSRLLLRALPPLVVVLLAFFGASLLMESAPQAGRRPPPERQARLVEVALAERVDRPVVVEAFGEVRPAREVTLRSQVGGQVTAVHPDLVPGGRVQGGAKLVEIERRDYELALQKARGELARAEADLALEQGQQAVARREFELLGRNGSEQERRLMLRQPQLQTAQGAVAAARAAVKSAELALERTALKAPFDALVLSREVVAGATVGASTDIASLAGTDAWWVEVALPVAALRWIELPQDGRPGSRVTLFDAAAWGADRHRVGRVVRLHGALEEQGRMARMLVEVDDPLALKPAHAGQPRLLLGAFLRARIQGRAVEQAVALDPAWLRQGETVWVMNAEDKLETRPVQIAWRGADTVLVSGGLAAGERVVTTPINAAAEGMPLRVRAQEGGRGR